MGQRLRTYKRIASSRDDAALEQIRRETEDRYGRPPESVERLFAYARLRRTAEEIRVISIDRTPTGVAFKFKETARVSPDKLLALIGAGEGASFSPSGVLRIETDGEGLIERAHRVLLDISSKG
jgi:transcription-repair coupling factor (superfamily II helicase)